MLIVISVLVAVVAALLAVVAAGLGRAIRSIDALGEQSRHHLSVAQGTRSSVNRTNRHLQDIQDRGIPGRPVRRAAS